MKKIELSVTQTGDENIVAQCAITVRVNGAFCSSSAREIALRAVDRNGSCEYSAYCDSISTIKMTAKTKSGAEIISYFKDERDILQSKYYDLFIQADRKPEDIASFLADFAEFLKDFEQKVFEAHKVTKSYIFVAV